MTVDRVRYQINTLTGQRLVALFNVDHDRIADGAAAAVCLRVWGVRDLTGIGLARSLIHEQAKEVYDDP